MLWFIEINRNYYHEKYAEAFGDFLKEQQKFFLKFISALFLVCISFLLFDAFYATDLSLYPMKTSENLSFSDVFRGYRKRPVV